MQDHVNGLIHNTAFNMWIMTVLKSLIYVLISMTYINGDFLSDLNKLDIDSKLRELKEAFNSIDNGDAPVVDKIFRKPKHEEDRADKEELSMDSAVEMLSGLFGGDCTYQCKNGNIPVPKIGHRPTSDGCGSYGLEIDTTDLPGMQECCHKHDHCYDTCNSERAKCDSQFKDCLHNKCTKLKTKSGKTTASYKDCKSASGFMYGGSVALGCDPYMKSQEAACTCSQPSSSKKSKSTGANNNSENAQNKKQTDTRNEQRNDKSTVKSQRKHSDEL